MSLFARNNTPDTRRIALPDSTAAFIIAMHALALVIFLKSPVIGAALLAVGAGAAVGLGRPLPVAAVVLALLWINVPIADFYPFSQATAWKDVLLLVMMVGWLARSVILRRPIALQHPVTYPLLLMIALFFVMSVATPSPVAAILGLKATVFYMAWFFLLPEIVHSERDVRVLLGAILFGTLCMGAYDLWRVTQPFGRFPATRAGKILPGALQAHLSGTAIFLGLGVLLGLTTAGSYRKWGRLLVYVVVIVGVAAILADLHRSVWFSTFVAVAVITVVSRRAQIVRAVVLVAIVGSMVQAFFPLNLATRATSAFDTEDTSTTERKEELSSRTVPFVLTHPMGAGTGTMSAVGALKVWGGGDMSQILMLQGQIHNGFMLVAIEIGWLGLVAYIWFLGACFVSALRLFRTARTPFGRDVGLALVGIMAYFIVENFSGSMLTTALFSFDIWIFVGLLVILPGIDEEMAGAEAALEPAGARSRVASPA